MVLYLGEDNGMNLSLELILFKLLSSKEEKSMPTEFRRSLGEIQMAIGSPKKTKSNNTMINDRRKLDVTRRLQKERFKISKAK